MAFDFKKLATDGAISTITDPAELFDALPNKAEGYGYLRAVQKTVLDAWASRRDDRDLVIKTNTGGGKTIVGLLILQCCINEGLAPALYLAPDPHTAGQVRDEARKLGLSVVDDPESSKFFSGQAICVTSVAVLINGKTRFGLATPGGRAPVRVRAVVVDDAHAALAQAEERTSLRIPVEHPAYDKLVDLFTDELNHQGANAFLDIREGDHSAVLRIPFWAWHDKRQQVLKALHPHRAEPDFQWSWPLISDLLHLCQAVVTTDAVEIMPPCPPIEKIPSFAEAERRIYLTATLADDSVLVTHFDADPDSVTRSIVPETAADLGDRLVLAPQEVNPHITHEAVRDAVRSLADRHNVVVLVPSLRQATEWSGIADLSVSKAADIGLAVERLKNGHVGLVIIVNRYDGIDLPDDACRVLLLDGLPQAYSGIERREAVALRDSDAMVTRQLQRLEQGMGRGVRSRDDRCAVILLGPRLTQLVARADVADRLSPATRAQLDLSRTVSGDLEGADLDTLVGVIEQVVNGDPGFRQLSREALVGVTYGPAKLSPIATHLRAAYNAAVAGRDEDAARHAEDAVNQAQADNDPKLAGWLAETHADYLHAIDAVRSQSVLTAGTKYNSAILRPVAGITYKKVKPAAMQAQQASEFLKGRYEMGADLLLGVEAVLADLVWDNERTKAAEAALAELAEHLGFTAQRPERDYGRGSDVLWALDQNTYAVIEAKSGATGDLIWKKDINQLSGSVNWCREEYGANAKITPVMMHPHTVVEKSGTPPHGARIMTATKVDSLKTAVRSYATALAQNDVYKDPSKVAEQLNQYKLTSKALIGTYTVLATLEK